jgi:hypothetical protein
MQLVGDAERNADTEKHFTGWKNNPHRNSGEVPVQVVCIGPTRWRCVIGDWVWNYSTRDEAVAKALELVLHGVPGIEYKP